jgi:hypothetical protein
MAPSPKMGAPSFLILKGVTMNLKDTCEMMTSPDYKERFKAEYSQLRIRMNGLKVMLEKYKEDTLPFTPSCTYDLLNAQWHAMKLYSIFLEERAKVEDIDLSLISTYFSL